MVQTFLFLKYFSLLLCFYVFIFVNAAGHWTKSVLVPHKDGEMKIVGERRRRGENGGGEGRKTVLGRILIERPHFHFPPLVFLAPGMCAWKRSLRRIRRGNKEKGGYESSFRKRSRKKKSARKCWKSLLWDLGGNSHVGPERKLNLGGRCKSCFVLSILLVASSARSKKGHIVI